MEVTLEQRRAMALAAARKRQAAAEADRRVPVEPTQVSEPGAPIPTQITEDPPATRRAEPKTLVQAGRDIGRAAAGVGDAATAIGSAAITTPAAGLAGIAEVARGGGMEGAARVVERGLQSSYQPRTELGRKIVGAAGIPGQLGERVGGAVGNKMLDLTGSPAAATAADTAVQGLPLLLGSRMPGMRGRNPREDIRRVQEAADELGIELNASSVAQVGQIGDAAKTMAPGAKGDAMLAVQEGMVKARDRVRDFKNRMYEQARSEGEGAFISREEVVSEVIPTLREVTKPFLMADMPAASRLMARAERIERLPEGSEVKLNAIEDWLRSVNANRPGPTKEAENTALNVMSRTVQEWLDTKFNADAISGSPEAVQAWRRARDANRNYRERFSDNKVIRDMVNMEATPETLRKWVFGASLMGAKSEAASVVKRVKSELGEGSPQMAALRQDALLDILEPILRPEPDLRGYIRNYDRFVRNNPTLVRELFPDSLDALRNLRDFSHNTAGRPTQVLQDMPGFSRIAGVAMFGHELARKALTVRAASAATAGLTRIAAGTPRRRAMAEILGYDPFAPMFGAASAAVGAATIGTGRTAEKQREREALQQAPRTPRAAP